MELKSDLYLSVSCCPEAGLRVSSGEVIREPFMRGAIIMSLIGVGGLLVAAPLIARYLQDSGRRSDHVRVLVAKPDVTRLALPGDDIPTGVQVVCVTVGMALVVAGVYLAVKELRTPLQLATKQN
jgi:hypothetical protein